MKTVLLFQAFWTDGTVPCTRTRNLLYSSGKIIRLVEYLRKNDIDAHFKIYDFSPQRVINESIHIPYPKGVYKRSQKLNHIINENKHYDFLFSFDSDAFFDPRDFSKIRDKINNLKDNSISLFEMASLDDQTTQRIIAGEAVDPFDDYRFSTFTLQGKDGVPLQGAFGGLGGVFICSTKLLVEQGGFNENFIQWGDEDVEVLYRIRDNTDADIVRNHDMFPFHLFHFRDMYNEDYISPSMRDERWELCDNPENLNKEL